MQNLKKIKLAIFILLLFAVSSCRVWEKVFPPKYGCKSDGKSVGAERLLSENKDKKQSAEDRKAARKAKRFKS